MDKDGLLVELCFCLFDFELLYVVEDLCFYECDGFLVYCCMLLLVVLLECIE